MVERAAIDRLLGEGRHQGLALSVAPLPRLDLRRPARPSPAAMWCWCSTRSTIRTISARSCARPPPSRCAPWSCPSGAAPSSAASWPRRPPGALDLVPVVEVVNLARALDELAALGYWRIALDADGRRRRRTRCRRRTTSSWCSAPRAPRRLVRAVADCDFAARLPIAPQMASLNVSVAIALYALARRHGGAREWRNGADGRDSILGVEEDGATSRRCRRELEPGLPGQRRHPDSAGDHGGAVAAMDDVAIAAALAEIGRATGALSLFRALDQRLAER